MTFSFQDYEVKPTGKVLHSIRGRTPGGEDARGQFHIHRIIGPGGVVVEVAYVIWDNGERNIQPTLCQGSPILDHLSSGRRRLGLSPLADKTHYSLLKQARTKHLAPSEWSGLFKATRTQLDEGCGCDVFSLLVQSGALRAGPKREVTGIDDRQRDWPAAVYSAQEMLAPCVAFALTRVIPLIRGYHPQETLF